MADAGKIDRMKASTGASDPISAVRLPADLTANVDAWAASHEITRSDAIRQLIELGLKASVSVNTSRATRPDFAAIEELVEQMDLLIDPATPPEERSRRIRRLTDGPPEFVEERIDLQKWKE